MHNTLEFPDRLRLIEERAAALRAAAASAPSLDVKVPTCPEWTLWDLVQHVGEGQSFWAAVVKAGPAPDRPGARSDFVDAAPAEREALLEWSAASTQRLVDALREAGPEAGCWTWWADSDSPRNTGAVARHQVQEVNMHAYDAQNAIGEPRPLPTDVALDGVEDFLSTCVATSSPWPHEPAELEFQTAEGPAWRLSLSAGGARSARLPRADAPPADAAARGTAGELVMWFYNRVGVEDLEIVGARRLFEQLRDWEPE